MYDYFDFICIKIFYIDHIIEKNYVRFLVLIPFTLFILN